MSQLQRIPMTDALKGNFALLRALVAADGFDWIVVRSNPRCEARAQASLTAAGLVAWLPRVPQVRKHTRSRRETDRSRPMCTRYLFVALERSKAQSTSDVVICDGVEAVLRCDADRRPHIVPARQMQVIVEECWSALTATKYQPVQALEIGAAFRILCEDFNGLEGEVTAYDRAKGRVEGTVRLFGGKVPVKVAVDRIATKS